MHVLRFALSLSSIAHDEILARTHQISESTFVLLKIPTVLIIIMRILHYHLLDLLHYSSLLLGQCRS